MDDLVTWLRAQLDEDVAWAVAASTPKSHWVGGPVPGGVHWIWGMGSNWDHYEPDPLEEYLGENWDRDGDDAGGPTLLTREEFDTHSVGRLALAVIPDAEEVRTVDAAHIARHDPARVLAEVEAKRRILRAHDVHCNGHCDDARWDPHAAHWWSVKVLATVYADRPGYREEWRPA